MSMTVIDFICEATGESCQIISDVIPTIGSKFSFSSSRSKGDYDPNGEVGHVFSGIVRKIDYLFEETGKSPISNMKTMYVTIHCDPVEGN